MGNYLPIYKQIWTSTKFNKLNANEKLIFLYLLSSPTSDRTGIFNMLLRQIACDIDLDIKIVQTAIKNMEKIGLLIYKEDKNMFYIVKMFKITKGTIKNPEILYKNIIRQEELHQDQEIWQLFKEDNADFYEKYHEYEKRKKSKNIDDS